MTILTKLESILRLVDRQTKDNEFHILTQFHTNDILLSSTENADICRHPNDGAFNELQPIPSHVPLM